MLKKFLKDSVIYAIPTFISGGLGFFLLPLYTRVLSPADYGSLDLFTIFGGLVQCVIALEVSQGVARFYADERDLERKVLFASSAFWFTLICYTVFAVLMLLNTNVLAILIMGQTGMEIAFQIGIVYLWSNGLFYLIQNQFRWELRSINYAIVSLLMSFVTAVVSVWLVYVMLWGLEGLLIGMVAGSLAGSSLGLWWLRKSFRFCFDSRRLREMLIFSTPLVISSLAVWLSTYIDRIMINHYLSIDEVGLYSIGFRIAFVAGLLIVGFRGALTPLIYTYYDEADTPRQLANIFRLFIFLVLLVFLVLSLFALDIVQLLTTEPFYGGSVVVVYLVPAILLTNMYIFAPGVGIAKKTHYLIWINISGALLNLCLNVLLIPPLGIVGAGLATMISSMGLFAMYMITSQKLYHVPHYWTSIALGVFVAALMAWWVPQFSLNEVARWALNLFALIVMVVISFAIGLIRVTEFKQGIILLKKSFGFDSEISR